MTTLALVARLTPSAAIIESITNGIKCDHGYWQRAPQPAASQCSAHHPQAAAVDDLQLDDVLLRTLVTICELEPGQGVG
tara:strand:+ start:906 stop:1142 length:237 start_codon:yes stop_codon:yes gene_type:complete